MMYLWIMYSSDYDMTRRPMEAIGILEYNVEHLVASIECFIKVVVAANSQREMGL